MSVSSSDAPADRMMDIVRELLKVAGGENAIALGEELLDDRVVMHMDGYTLRGRRRWKDFIRYLRKRRAELGLRLRCSDVTVEGELATFRGAWHRENDDLPDAPVLASFRISDGRVVELWSRRENYVELFGERILSRWGFWLFAIKAWLWCRLSRRERND